MAFSNEYRLVRARPLWLPHPSLLAVIALLWVLAGAADLLTFLKH